MKKIVTALLVLSLSAFAYEARDVTVEFTAFKTPLKKGVEGRFKNVVLSSEAAQTLEDMLLNTRVRIDTTNVNTGNKGRDKKLVTSFFSVQQNRKIEAKVVEVKQKILKIAVTMNDTTVTVPMKYEIEDDAIEAEGVIDLADFGMLPSLRAINKACYDLHQGKTWQDVEIEFKLRYRR